MQKCKNSHSFVFPYVRASLLWVCACFDVEDAWTAWLESSTTLERFLTFSCSLALPRSPFYRPFSWFELTRTQFSQGSRPVCSSVGAIACIPWADGPTSGWFFFRFCQLCDSSGENKHLFRRPEVCCFDALKNENIFSRRPQRGSKSVLDPW